MDQPIFERSNEARELLADYGAAMYEVQLFEFTLLGLVNAQEHQPELQGSEENRRRLETLFASPAGRLRQRAKIDDPDLGEQLEQTIRIRNGLAHTWLIHAGLNLAAERTSREEERDRLYTAARVIRDMRERLQKIFHQTLSEMGLEPYQRFTAEQLRVMLDPDEAGSPGHDPE